MDRTAAEAFYRRYIERCNAHDFSRLGEFVARDVRVNGERRGLDAYIAGLESVVEAFPDLHWDLRQLVVEPPWLAARFVDTGTYAGTIPGLEATGRPIRIREFAQYRLEADRIAEAWGDLPDPAELARGWPLTA